MSVTGLLQWPWSDDAQKHRRRANLPARFRGTGDAVLRICAGPWITFPRFVLSGDWYRNLRA